jgi:threonine dehydratase
MRAILAYDTLGTKIRAGTPSRMAAERWTRESGALAVHAYDQPETLLGQGTVALELERQASLDTLLVAAVGGGGLIGGMADWYGGRVNVIGVEPEAAPTLFEAFRAGRPVDAPAGGIAADSLAPRRVGEVMFPIAQAHVERVVLVSDDAIRRAQQALWEAFGVVAEPGGAATTAALLAGALRGGSRRARRRGGVRRQHDRRRLFVRRMTPRLGHPDFTHPRNHQRRG